MSNRPVGGSIVLKENRTVTLGGTLCFVGSELSFDKGSHFKP